MLQGNFTLIAKTLAAANVTRAGAIKAFITECSKKTGVGSMTLLLLIRAPHCVWNFYFIANKQGTSQKGTITKVYVNLFLPLLTMIPASSLKSRSIFLARKGPCTAPGNAPIPTSRLYHPNTSFSPSAWHQTSLLFWQLVPNNGLHRLLMRTWSLTSIIDGKRSHLNINTLEISCLND